jgi:hypothetical protein
MTCKSGLAAIEFAICEFVKRKFAICDSRGAGKRRVRTGLKTHHYEEPGSFATGSERAGRKQVEEKRDFSLRRPTLSQERKGKKRRRPAPFEMTGEGGESDRELEEEFGGDVEAAAEALDVVLVEVAFTTGLRRVLPQGREQGEIRRRRGLARVFGQGVPVQKGQIKRAARTNAKRRRAR